MRVLPLLLALFLLCCPPVVAGGWDDLFTERRDGSLAYRQARLSLRKAELALERYTQPWLPSLTVGTAGASAPRIQDGVFSGTLSTTLSFANLLGADLSLGVPVRASSTGAVDMGDPSLTLSRKLFVEDGADRMEAEAALLRARAALRDAENSVRLQLVTDVLQAEYYGRLLEANRSDLEVLERVRKATVKPASLREVERRILQAEKAILSASQTLAGLDAKVRDRAAPLYGEVLSLAASWTAALPESDPTDSAAIRAQELSLRAAEERRAFSLLPYLPNPKLTAELSYDVDAAALHWGLSLQFSLAVLDRGEREVAVLERTENAALERIRLEAARKGLADAVRQARNSLAVLELDRRLQDLDIEDERDNVARLEALYRGGYVSEEDLVVGRVDLSIEQLSAVKIDHDILVQKLKLVQATTVE